MASKAEIHTIVFAAVMRALRVGVSGVAKGGRQAIAINAAVRASTEIEQLLAQEQTPKGNPRQ